MALLGHCRGHATAVLSLPSGARAETLPHRIRLCRFAPGTLGPSHQCTVILELKSALMWTPADEDAWLPCVVCSQDIKTFHPSQMASFQTPLGQTLTLKSVHTEASLKGWMRWLLQVCKHPCKITRNVRKQGNMSPQKGCDHFQLTNPKEMVICELLENKQTNTQLKVIILRKLSEI